MRCLYTYDALLCSPRYAKILVMASRINLLSHGIALISILADKSPFFQPHESSFKNVKEDNSDEESDEDLEGSDTGNKPTHDYDPNYSHMFHGYVQRKLRTRRSLNY